MKRFCIAGLVALSLGLSTSAMAKDLDPIDVFVGDFVGVASIDFDKLIANKMISDAIDQGVQSEAELGEALAILKAAGIDYKKDISTIAVASTEKGRVCVAVDTKVPLVKVIDELSKDPNVTAKEHKGLKVYKDSDVTYTTVGDKRFLICDSKFDLAPMIDNVKADKPKTLKDRDSVLYNAYNATSKSADIRAGGKMTKYLREKAKTYTLSDEKGTSVGVSDVDSASFSLGFTKGLDLALIAHAKSADIAAAGSQIINAQVISLLSDDSLKELGLGFLKDAVKIVNDKKDLKATIKFTDDQMNTLAALASELAAAAPAPQKAAPAKKEAVPAGAK